jgi:hypothetical protein
MSTLAVWWITSELSIDLSGLTATVEAFAPPRHQPEHRMVGYTGQDPALDGDSSQAPTQEPAGTSRVRHG